MFIVKIRVLMFANFMATVNQIWILFANKNPAYSLASQGPVPHPLPMQSVHRLNIELDLLSLFGSVCIAVLNG